MLRAIFTGRMEVLSDSDGWILIHRGGEHFNITENFLRDSRVSLPELLAEAKYYCIQELACNKKKRKRRI